MLRSVILGVTLATLPFAPAHAAPDEPGRICHLVSLNDPTGGDSVHVGLLGGEAVQVTENLVIVQRGGTLICRVQVGVRDHTGTGPEVSGHVDASALVGTAGPNLVRFEAGATDEVYVCTEWVNDSDGVTLYWDDPKGTWSTDAHVPCTG